MAEEKVDLRVRKTRRALTEALWVLLREKSFDKITVRELCERAEVRKATFYTHFSDKVELLAYLMEQMQEQASRDNAIGYDESDPKSYYLGVFRYFMGFLEENEDFVRSVLRSSASSGVLDVLTEEIEVDIRLHLKHESDPLLSESSALLASFFAGGIVNCGRWWISQPVRPSREEAVARFSALIGRFWETT